MVSDRMYLDFNDRTPIAPEVADAMRPFLARRFGNPSSFDDLVKSLKRS